MKRMEDMGADELVIWRAKKRRDSLIKRHIEMERDVVNHQITSEEAALIFRIKDLCYILQDGYYNPIKKEVFDLVS